MEKLYQCGLWILLMVVALPAHAQLEEAKKALAAGQCEDAARAYRTYLNDNRLQLVAQLGLAAVYAQPGCPLYDLEQAYGWLAQFYPAYQDLNDKAQERLREAGLLPVGRVRAQVLDSLVARAYTTGDPDSLEVRAARYTLLRRNQVKALQEESLRLRVAALRGAPWESWAAFWAERQPALRHLSGLLDTVQHGLAAAWVAHRGWDAWPEFSRTYPANRYAEDAQRDVFQQLLGVRNPDAYDAFSRAYPRSAWVGSARDSATAIRVWLAAREQRIDQLIETLNRADQPQAWPDADRQLAAYLDADGPLQARKAPLLRRTPPARFPATLEVYRLRVAAAGSVGAWSGFLRQFPLYPVSDELANQLRQLRATAYATRQQQLSERIRRALTPDLAYRELVRAIQPELAQRYWSEALYLAQTQDSLLGSHPYYRSLVEALARDEPDYEPVLLGGQVVNSGQDEYTPVLTLDGSRLYYCYKASPESREVIRQAAYRDGRWEALGEVPNLLSAKNMAPLSLSADGNRLLLFQGGDMLYADRTDAGWSTPTAFPSPINGSDWQGMGALSADGQVLIFETKGRPGMAATYDNIDLFVSFRLEGQAEAWSTPVGLSALINSSKLERSPFLHPDMRTLYFSTDARGGFGGLDVFKTTRLDDTWLLWSEPVHLGRSVNTPGDDWGYKVTTDGRYAYFSGDPDGDHLDDIYLTELPPTARPQPVTLLQARVLSPDGQPLEGSLRVEDLATGELVAVLRTEPGTGRVSAALPNDRQYGLVFDDGSRIPFADNLDLRNADTSGVLQTVIQLKTVEEYLASGEAITLRNIFFDLDQATLRSESAPELQRLLAMLAKNPTLQVEISGHTDNQGSPEYNQGLSRRRAEAVRAELIRLGAPAARLTARGYGQTQPIASNETETGRAQNRRVEMKLR